VSLGITAALNGGRLDRSFFDAAARHEAEIDDLEYDTNRARQEAALLAKFGM
jgi:hypothetical protein